MKEFKLKITEETSDIESIIDNLYEDNDIEYLSISNYYYSEIYNKDIKSDLLLDNFLGRKYILGNDFPYRISVGDLSKIDIDVFGEFDIEGSKDLNKFAREKFINLMNDIKRRIIHIQAKGYEENIDFHIILKQNSQLTEKDFEYLKDIINIKDYYFEYKIIDYKEIDGIIYSGILNEDSQIFRDSKCEEYMFETFQSISDSCDKSNIEELKKEYL